MTKDVTKILEEFRGGCKTDVKDFRHCVEREIRRLIREMGNSMSFMNEQFEEIKVALQSNIDDNAQLKGDNATLKKKYEDLQKRLLENECRATQCEQYSRKCNLGIKGIPEGSGDDIFDIVKKIGNLVNENIIKEHVEFCHRLPALGN